MTHYGHLTVPSEVKSTQTSESKNPSLRWTSILAYIVVTIVAFGAGVATGFLTKDILLGMSSNTTLADSSSPTLTEDAKNCPGTYNPNMFALNDPIYLINNTLVSIHIQMLEKAS